MEQQKSSCSFRPLFKKCPLESAAGTFFFRVIEYPQLMKEIERELGRLPSSFKICSNHFIPGSASGHAHKKLTSKARIDWSSYSTPQDSLAGAIKKEKDTICGFNDLVSGLAEAISSQAWRDTWNVYENTDGVCFYRFTQAEDFSDVSISFKILIQKNMDVLLYNGESLSDFQELQWILDNCKLETWKQLWRILDYYSSEPEIIKKSNSHRLIQKALDLLNKIEDSSEIIEIIEPIKQMLVTALFKASEVVEVINLLEPKTEIVPEVTMLVESDNNDTMEECWKLDDMVTKQESEAAVQSMLLDSIEKPCTSRTSRRERRESTKNSETHLRSSDRRSKSSDEPETFLCDKCEKFFDSRSKLWMHLYRVHDMTYFCDLCGRKFSCKGSVRNHVETHLCPEERRQVNCPHCEMKMIRGSLRRHIRTAHQGWKARPCKYCSKSFTTTATLLQHENAHIKCQDLGELKFTCPKCSRTFNKGRNFFEQHLSECSTGAIPKRRGNNLYPCSICGSRFQSKVVCSKHMAMKHNYQIKDPKTYCFTCKKDVEDPFNHAKLHNCQFICPLCGKRFRYQVMLDKHVDEKHNDANRPWKCEACSLSFRTNNHLQSHIANMHMPEEEKRYSCDVCDKRFGLKSFLNYHLKHFHATAEIYTCTYCGKNFKYLHIMKRHCLNVHRDDPFPCSDCPLKFKVQNDLDSHREKHHGAVMALQKYRDS